MKPKRKIRRNKDGDEFVCKCECGGNVWGSRSFGQLWTACDRCSPVVTINVDALSVRHGPAKRGKK